MFRFCRNLKLLNVVQAATHIAKKAVELDVVPGRSLISVAAVAIYMASQVNQILKQIPLLSVPMIILFLHNILFYIGNRR